MALNSLYQIDTLNYLAKTTCLPSNNGVLDEKRPAVYHEELLLEQRENARITTISRTIQTTQTPSPTQQRALLLQAAQQPYALVTDHATSTLIHKDEILIKVTAIGLNPINWKGPYVSPL